MQNLKKTSQKLLLVLFFMYAFSADVSAQAKHTGTISGRVIDATTFEPITNVNLFFANTTIGTTTGKDGHYLIKNIPPGVYELIVSHISYELKTNQIKFFTPDSSIRNFELKSRIIEGKNVEVVANIPKEWKQNLELFTELFIGKSKNAKKCKILNPEFINFSTDPKTGELTASSDSTIHVENRALGYQVHIILKTFEYKKDDFLKFIIYPKFETIISEKDKEQEHWFKNRIKTYNGSFRHFMKALTGGKSDKEKFSISFVIRPGKFNRIRVIPSKESFLTPHGFGLNRFYFNGYMNVRHKNKGNSWIKMDNYLTLVDSLGNFYPSNAIRKWGAWADERIADLLPLDYNLEK